MIVNDKENFYPMECLEHAISLIPRGRYTFTFPFQALISFTKSRNYGLYMAKIDIKFKERAVGTSIPQLIPVWVTTPMRRISLPILRLLRKGKGIRSEQQDMTLLV